MKDIIIIADFCGPLDGTFNSRFLYLADMLVSEGHNVEIVTSDFDHGKKIYIDYEIEKHDYKITMLHEGYYPRNICLRRFWGHSVWGINVYHYLKKRKRSDVVYCAVPTLTAAYLAAKYCERNNVRFVIDIQDLWPEAFKLAFNVPVISDIIFLPFNMIANGIYKRADSICAVSETYATRAARVDRKCKDTHAVFLGTELAAFDKYVRENSVVKSADELWLGYCGTLGASYDITIVIDALAMLKKRRVKTPKFIVMGDGERKSEFEEHAKKLGVDCLFTGRLPYEQMCGRLAACDIVVNPIKHGSAGSIINKHGDYAAAGIPVINTQECSEYRKLVKEYKMGFNCRNGDAEGIANRLEKLIDEPLLRLRMGKRARKCAEERFDRQHTYISLCDSIVSK